MEKDDTTEKEKAKDTTVRERNPAKRSPIRNAVVRVKEKAKARVKAKETRRRKRRGFLPERDQKVVQQVARARVVARIGRRAFSRAACCWRRKKSTSVTSCMLGKKTRRYYALFED
jgi:hypothetical protein